MFKHTFFILFVLISFSLLVQNAHAEMKLIKGGEYLPLYLKAGSPLERVQDFLLDEFPVTNEDFLRFVNTHPEWQKDKPSSLFAEQNYLKHWPVSLKNRPVVFVSWFAAQAYCEAHTKRLPYTAEWEYVANASEHSREGYKEAEFRKRILDWYATPSTRQLSEIGQHPANIWGVKDLHGLIWEWTADFNSTLMSGESRAADSNIDQGLFCGAGASATSNPEDYAAFMRFGFRSSLQAHFTLGNLGFRCAKDL